MHTRTLGQGLRVSAIGLGAMGMSQSYGPNPGRPRRHDRRAALRGRRGRHVLRHRRGLRAVRQRGTRRRGARAAARPGRHRHQVRLAASRTARSVGLDSRPEQIRRVADASLQRLRHRRDRPVLPAPRRPGRADRGRRRRGRRAGRRPARSGTSGCPRPAPRPSAAPTPCTRSPRCRASTRCGPATRSRRCCRRCAELGIGFVPFSPLGKGFLTGTVDAATRSSPPATSAPPSRGSPPRTAPPTRRWSSQVRSLAEAKDATPGSDRAGLAAGPAAVDRADPGTRRLAASRRTPAATQVALSADEVADLDALAARVGVQGDRYNAAGMAMVGL